MPSRIAAARYSESDSPAQLAVSVEYFGGVSRRETGDEVALAANAEFGHFMLLFCRGRQRNVPRIITHVHSHCFAH